MIWNLPFERKLEGKLFFLRHSHFSHILLRNSHEIANVGGLEPSIDAYHPAMSRWFVKDGICPVQRRSGKNVAYRGAFWRWVAGVYLCWTHGFGSCTILFCISLGARPMQRILYHFQSHGTHVQVPCREVSMQMASNDWEITAVRSWLLTDLCGFEVSKCWHAGKVISFNFGLFVIAMLPEGDALFAALQCFYCGWHHVCSSFFGRSQQCFDKNGLLSCRKQSKGYEGGMLRTVQIIDQWL